jgi:hypothetical protein
MHNRVPTPLDNQPVVRMNRVLAAGHAWWRAVGGYLAWRRIRHITGPPSDSGPGLPGTTVKP